MINEGLDANKGDQQASRTNDPVEPTTELGIQMTATNATWVKHPGFYIKEEMEERGWLQRDLAFVLGVPAAT